MIMNAHQFYKKSKKICNYHKMINIHRIVLNDKMKFAQNVVIIQI